MKSFFGPLRETVASWRSRPRIAVPRGSDELEVITRRFLLYGVMPLWFVPAVTDYLMHRRTDIEHTSGTRESAIHALMMAEAGIPVMLGLFARINPLVLGTMYVAAGIHAATALWDVQVATEDREVHPMEQHIHSFLEVLPLTAIAFLSCLHWDQVRAFTGDDPDRWKLLPKRERLSGRYVASITAAVGGFIVLPYGEELFRCIRTRCRSARGRG